MRNDVILQSPPQDLGKSVLDHAFTWAASLVLQDGQINCQSLGNVQVLDAKRSALTSLIPACHSQLISSVPLEKAHCQIGLLQAEPSTNITLR